MSLVLYRKIALLECLTSILGYINWIFGGKEFLTPTSKIPPEIPHPSMSWLGLNVAAILCKYWCQWFSGWARLHAYVRCACLPRSSHKMLPLLCVRPGPIMLFKLPICFWAMLQNFPFYASIILHCVQLCSKNCYSLSLKINLFL